NYDPKVHSLLEQFALVDKLVPINELDSKSLSNLLDQNWQKFRVLFRKIQGRLPQVAQLAHHNLEMTLSLLESDAPLETVQSEYTELLSSAVLTLSNNLDAVQRQNLALEKTNQQLIQTYENLVTQKQTLDKQYHDLQEEFNQKVLEMNRAKAELSQNVHQLGQTQAELAHHLRELDTIKSSRGWKVLFSLWQLRLAIIPKASKREALFNKLFHPQPGKDRQMLAKAVRTIKRKLDPKLSWPAFSFRNFKFKRQQLWPQNLNKPLKTFTSGLVSIVLPVHNGERYVETAIQSVLDQTYPHFELIVVDDGSTDGTPSIVDSLVQKDQRITVLHQSNLKLPGALNAGFAAAHGEFFTWTSDDNLLLPEFLEKMVVCLQRHPDWHMIYANMDLIEETGAPLKKSGWYEGYQFPHSSEHIHLPND
ncbi:glycosyltransferase, partial [bacterium]|nr:glycosyltransferase [bacterium]